jgi:hypothetical protein
VDQAPPAAGTSVVAGARAFAFSCLVLEVILIGALRLFVRRQRWDGGVSSGGGGGWGGRDQSPAPAYLPLARRMRVARRVK